MSNFGVYGFSEALKGRGHRLQGFTPKLLIRWSRHSALTGSERALPRG
jgi:hypothetical protein